MSDVLVGDGEATPITPARPEGHYCDLCEHAPFRTAGGLAGHKAAKHGVTGAKKKGAAGKGADDAKPQAKPLAKRLEQSFGIIGVGIYFVEPYDGRCIVAGAPGLGDSLAQLAEAYPETRKYIEAMCLDSPALAVVIATLPVLLPIMKHHGIIRIDLPPAFAGPPGGKPAEPAPRADGEAPGGPAEPDLGAILGSLGPLAAAMQADAARPRPMGEGAPAPAKPAAKHRAPAGSPADDGAELPAGDGEPA